ncbi:hypothetical protein [Pseudomonas sp. B15(2017)]|uniref:hypothetical protein n=1 Tax=Pseudomonas sp. B15(2017) TaxID=1981744 RepID=UPI000A1F5D32|nr:hypothetical protein [Pseudomonas sp. B15(2017)]
MKTELALYRALIAINIPEAKAHAFAEAMESDMRTLLATKFDVMKAHDGLMSENLKLQSEIDRTRLEIAHLAETLTVRIATMMVVTVIAIVGAMSLLN